MSKDVMKFVQLTDAHEQEHYINPDAIVRISDSPLPMGVEGEPQCVVILSDGAKIYMNGRASDLATVVRNRLKSI